MFNARTWSCSGTEATSPCGPGGLRRGAVVGILLGLILAAVPLHEAHAQVRSAALARMKLLNNKAMDEYDSLEFEAAKGILEEALSVAKSASITRGKTLTATLLNLGIIYGAGLNDRINAIKFFTLALRVNASAAIDPTRATPVMEEIFKTAKENVAQAPPVKSPGRMIHDSVDEAVTGRPVVLYAKISPGSNVKRVLLFHRAGTAGFKKTRMRRKRPGLYVGVIPVRAVRGRSIHYYLEAQDPGGDRVQGHGTPSSPNIIVVKRGKIRPRPRPRPRPGPKGRKTFSVGLMVGIGLGIVNGGQSEHQQPQNNGAPFKEVEINPGGAIAPFHLAPELIYHLNQNWHLSVIGRIQIVNAISSSGRVSLLGEARAKRFFGEGPFRFYLAFGAGGGQIRHRIPLGDYDKDGGKTSPDDPNHTSNNLVDSRVSSMVAFGFGGGLTYMFSSYVGAVIELNGLIMVPNFAANLDLNTGLLLSF